MSTSNAPAPAAATVAIDTGGTFTDLVAIGTDGSVRIAKSPSTPNAPLGALLDVLEKSAVPVEAIDRIVHGTTVATNAVIQRRGAGIAYVTTAGFEDVPFIQRINRRSEYDLHWLKPQPLVKRRNCLSVAERIVDVLFGCLSQAVPRRVAAATGASSCNFLFGGVHPRTGEYYANYHIEGCGWGGKDTGDGNHIQCPINGNWRNTPVEVFETRYPWLTECYRLAEGSGGHGRHRGGFGSVRVLEARAPEITVSSFMDRHESQAWGLFGGQAGAPGALRREALTFDGEFTSAGFVELRP